jgi:hypothetical protein
MDVAREFRSPYRKLERARTHISELEDGFRKFVAGIKCQNIVEPIAPIYGGLYQRWVLMYERRCREAGRLPQDPPDETAYVHKVRFDMPDMGELEAIAADAIQNLRQALDHAACACARSIGKTDKSTYFPLVADPNQLEDRIKDQAQKLPPSIKDLIRKAEPGGGLLYELHSLGGGDKHRLICNFASFTVPKPNLIRSKGGWIVSGFGSDDWDAANGEVRIAMSGSPDETDYDFNLEGIVSFNTGGVISSKPPFIALNEIANTVGRVIWEMEAEMTLLLRKS